MELSQINSNKLLSSNSNNSIYKPVTFWLLAAFILIFPILEGISNEIFPIGTKFLGYLVAFFWIIESFFYRKIASSFSIIILFLFLMWNVLSLLWTIDVDSSISRIIGLINVFLFYWIIIDLVNTQKKITVIIICYVIGIIILNMSALYNIFTDKTYAGIYNRYSGIGIDPNNFAIMTTSIMPFLFLLAWMKKSFWKITNFYFIVLSVLAYTAFSTGSRASVVAVISLFIVYSIIILTKKMKQPYRVRILIITVITAIIIISIFNYYIPEKTKTRLLSIFSEHPISGRSEAWRLSFKIGLENIILGIGTGAFQSLSKSYFSGGLQPHNTFLAAFAELGIIGCLIWFFLWIYHFRLLIKNSIYQNDIIGMGIFLSTIAIAVGAVTLNWEIRKPIYLLWGLALALNHIQSSSEHK